MSRLWPALLPELREFPSAEQEAALRCARDTALDSVELLGIAFALLLVTALTRYGLPEPGVASRFAAAMLNFVVALPLLALALGPLHRRRLRRGLREQLQRRSRP